MRMLEARIELLKAGVILADGGRVQELRDSYDEVLASVNEIIALADDEDRDLDEDELKEIEDLQKKAQRINAQIEARSAANRIKPASRGRRSSAAEPEDEATDSGMTAAAADRRQPAQRQRVRASVPAVPDADRGTFGFRSFGEFAACVHRANVGDHTSAERMVAAATTYGNESTGADGGFLVPPDFRQEIMRQVQGEDSLMSRCEEFVTGTNNVTMPKDETAPWDNSSTSGIRVFWRGEGSAMTQSNPTFQNDQISLDQLTALVPMTEELLEDAVGMESYLRVKTPQKMTSAVNTAIYRGNGVGKPIGIMGSPSLITVTKELSQDVDTVVFENISKMWSRMYAPWRREAIWLINQDIEPQLDQLAFPAGTGTAVPLYMPSGGLSASPFATLKGRPVVPIEPCSTVGTTGDITLVNLRQYMILKKAGDVREDTSIHLYFDQNITAFRFIFRMTGKPMWSKVITPENGTNTRSWAVTIEDRD